MSENQAQADTTELGATQAASGAQNQTQQTVADDLASYQAECKALLESDGADGGEGDSQAGDPSATEGATGDGGKASQEAQGEAGKPEAGAEAGKPGEVAEAGQEGEAAGTQEGEGQSGETADVLPDRVRLTNFEDRDKQAIALVKSKTARNLGEAMKMLEVRDGSPGQKEESESTEQAHEFSNLNNIQSVESERRRLQGEIRKAESDLRFEDKHQLEDKLDLLMNHGREVLRRAEETNSKIDVESREYKKQAAESYPQLTDKNSALFKEVVRLNGLEREKNTVLYQSPEKFLLLAERAAINLRKNGVEISTPKTGRPSTTSGVKQKPAGVTSGNAGTQAKISSNQDFDKRLESVNSIDDFEKLLKTL